MESGRIPPRPQGPNLPVPARPPSNSCYDFSSKLLELQGAPATASCTSTTNVPYMSIESTTASAVATSKKRPRHTSGLQQQQKQQINSEKRQLLHDRLGKTVQSSMIFFENARSWSQFVQTVRGCSHIRSTVGTLPHPAAALLKRLQTVGVPIVTTGTPWTAQQLDEKVARGPHKSANEHCEFVREEMAEFCEKGFWVVLPYDMVKQLPGLKLSPLGVVPQRAPAVRIGLVGQRRDRARLQ